MEDFRSCINALGLESLPKDWISELMNSNFSEETQLPEELTVGPEAIHENIACAISGIKKWIKQRKAVFPKSPPLQGEYSWQILMEWKLPKEGLICLLSTFIKHDIDNINNGEIIIRAFDAGRLYTLFLGVPGASIFNFFHHEIFNLIFGLLKVGKKLVKDDSSFKKTKKNDNPTENDGSETQEEKLTPTDKQEILKRICLFLCEMSEALDIIELSSEHILIDTIVQSLISIISLEKKSNVFTCSPPVNTIGYAVLKAYEVLEKFCSDKQGNVRDNIRTILKGFGKVMYQRDEAFRMCVKDDNGICRDHVFSFLLHIMKDHEEEATDFVIAFAQQLLVRIPDKADIRIKITSEISAFVEKLPSQLFQDYIVWVVSLSFGEAVKNRAAALEVVSKFLGYEDKTVFARMHELLISSLISNSIDRSALIRYKSLNIFASSIFSKQPGVEKLMNNLFVNTKDFYNTEPLSASNIFDFNVFFTECKEKKEFNLPDSILPPGNHIVKLLEYLSLDKKVFVRKNALQALSSICLMNKNWINSHRLKMVNAAKLRNPSSSMSLWRTALNYNLNDNLLASVCQICSNLVWTLFMDVVHLDDGWMDDGVTGGLREVFSIFSPIIELTCKDTSVLIRKQMTKCITDLIVKYPLHQKVVEAWVNGIITLISDNDVKNQEKVLEYIYKIVFENINHADEESTPESTLPWRILKIIAKEEKRSLFKLACNIWLKEGIIKEPTLTFIVSHTNSSNSYMAWFLIVCLSDFFDYPNPGFIYEYFIQKIHLHYNRDPALELTVMEALFLNVKHISQKHKDELFPILKSAVVNFKMPIHLIGPSLNILALTNFTATKEVCGILTKVSGEYIWSHLKPDTTDQISAPEMSRYIFTFGDAALFHPGVDSNALDCIVKIVDSPEPDKRIKPSRVDLRAVAVVALSKICLQDHFLAKKHIPKLAFLLDEGSTKDTVKINTLAALADLCIRFTSVVEDYIGFMCIALKDNCEDVRKCALEHIIDLLLQDYLKLKGPLFYYLLTMLLDPCERIVECYKSFINDTVLKRNPSIMTQFFIQAIFFFNDCGGKKGFGNEQTSTKESILFGLAGVTNFKYREKIYKFMLSVMQDDHRLRVLNNILLDILDQVCENKLELNTMGNAVLKDALNVMACPEMRFENLRKEDEDKPIEDNTSEDYVLGMAKKVILNQILKKNYVESLVPIVAVLRRKLLDLRSPLAKDLMICLREMMKDYKREVNEIFAEDKQLAKEIALDLEMIDVDTTLMEELEQADLIVQEQINCISQLALNDTGIVEYRSIQEMLGGGEQEEDSPDEQQPVGFLTNVLNLSTSKSPTKEDEPPKIDQLPTETKSSFRKKELPIFQPFEQTDSLPSTSDVSTEYSSNMPLSAFNQKKDDLSTSTQSTGSDTSVSSIPRNKRRKRKGCGKL